MTYAEESDLLTGSIPLPAYIDVNQWLQDGADEIDVRLGSVYVTPVILPDKPSTGADPYRQSRLILKYINARISSARIIFAAAAGGEDSETHAYARFLLREATTALNKLANGDPELLGAELLPTEDDRPHLLVDNVDPYSQVDRFYEMTNPGQTMFGGR